MNKNRLDSPYLLMSILLVLWGSLASVSKMALKTLDNYQVQFFMFGSAFIMFTLFLIFKGRIMALLALRPKDFGKLMIYGFLHYFYYFFYILSLALIPVVEASMLNYMFPIFIVLLSVPMFGERLTSFKVISLLLGFFGMIVIVTNGNLASIRLTNLGGDLLALAGALSWALFSGMGKKNKIDQDLSIYIYMLVAFVLSTIGLIAFSSFIRT